MTVSVGTLLRLVREGQASNRTELAQLTGLGRSTVSQRVSLLLDHNLLSEVGEGESTGGRPPTLLEFNADAGVVLAADLGATHSRLAVTDLAGTTLASFAEDVDIARGPDVVLPWACEHFERLLADLTILPESIASIGIGVPGPVEFAEGRVVNPPIMPGWDGVPIRAAFAERFDAPVLVDNDVNIMALGEHWTHHRHVEDLLYVKLGTGIGCGIVAGGRIHRGAHGAAGDIGHVQLATSDAPCRCGNTGCLESVAGGAALARQVRDLGLSAAGTREVAALARSGESEVARLVRDAGRALGEVLAALVNFFNPEVIVLGGDLAAAHELVLAGAREVCYQRSTALATRHLDFARSRLGEQAGIVGAAVTAIEAVLDPATIDAALSPAA